MATLFLLRHGLTAQTGKVLYGQTRDIPLDHRGRAEAEALVARFAAVRLTAIYSSPLERCVETVEPLAAAQRLHVVQRHELIEMHAGDWTGKPLGRLRRTKAWREVQGSPSTFRFPGGGESFAEASARIVGEVERIARRHRRGRVAIVTHGDPIRLLLAHFQAIPLDGFQRVVVDTASVSVVATNGGRAHVLLVNDTGGLSRFGTRPEVPWEAAEGAPRRDVRG
jgi:probable phosphomutase (TIGR03848 family)